MINTLTALTRSAVTDDASALVLNQVHELVSNLLGPPPADQWKSAVACCNIIAELGLGDDALMTAAIVPLTSGHPTWLEAIEKSLPAPVRKLLIEVNELAIIDRLDTMQDDPELGPEQGEQVRRLLLAMVNDPRGVIIKLGIQLQTLRAAKKLAEPARQEIARLTQTVYAPLANRLGVWQIKWEMEDLALRYLRPDIYKQIASSLAERRVDREKYMVDTVRDLDTALATAGITAQVKGRPKHIFSIWKKMQGKHLRFDELYDVRAVRVIVDDIPTCYTALGIVHSLWVPIASEFDDYIGSPKGNNYQSLHTAVRGPRGLTVEVQIRTQKMHDHAELGVAAHWRYKEDAGDDRSFDQKINWLRNVIDEAKKVEDQDLLQTVSQEVFNERVYVVSPRGQVIDLPADSTPIDFAYQIHTDVGHHCRGAKVNGHIVPLTYPLQNGDKVEIITAGSNNQTGPSRDWLNPELGYTVTTKARSRVRQWFKSQNQEQNAAAGRQILDRELTRLGLDKKVSFEKLVTHYNHSNVDTLLGTIGAGDITAAQLASTLQRLYGPEPEQRRLPNYSLPTSQTGEIIVQGVGTLMNSLARCCRPVPGDPISGYVTKGRGVSVHRNDCNDLLRLVSEHPDRAMEVSWGASKKTYPVDVRIEAYDRSGLLRDITSVMASDGVNVQGIASRTDRDQHKAVITITVEITGLEELSRITNRLIQVPNVTKAWRN